MDRQLIDRFLDGDRRALARLLTRVENQDDEIMPTLGQVFSRTGNAWRIGVTGPPGAGKSTLVNGLVERYRDQDQPVGVVAFDPTSPFTGGAVLGDRVRMEKVSRDPEVFIRSMATRGHLGGLAVGVDEACDLMDAFGKSRVFIETVGVGQSELEVADSADTTLVVIVPQSGDAIQALKAGLMEIADIYILNKCDRDGADEAHRELQSILHLKYIEEGGWAPPIVRTVARSGEGLDEIVEAVKRHREHLESSGALKQRREKRVAAKTRRFSEYLLLKRFWSGRRDPAAGATSEPVGNPYDRARSIVSDFYEEIRHEEE